MPAPDPATIPAFYHNYLRLVTQDSLQEAIDGRMQQLASLLRDLPEEDWNYAYAPGKWSLKDVVQHIIDAERIFSYRALCIARRDPHALPGFDEGSYAANSGACERSGASILEELHALDKSTGSLFASFSEQQLAAEGIANGAPVSVHSIGYILTGHALHHTGVIRERYLDPDYTHADIS
jgi:hypothetical protein